MRFRVLLVLFAILIAGPAFAQKIYIDYDKEYDGSKNKTFAWGPEEATTPRPSRCTKSRYPSCGPGSCKRSAKAAHWIPRYTPACSWRDSSVERFETHSFVSAGGRVASRP